jgi:hypothetical protein
LKAKVWLKPFWLKTGKPHFGFPNRPFATHFPKSSSHHQYQNLAEDKQKQYCINSDLQQRASGACNHSKNRAPLAHLEAGQYKNSRV